MLKKCSACGEFYETDVWIRCPFCNFSKQKEVKNMTEKTLPKFPTKIRISKYGNLEVTVYLNEKYVKKVLGIKE